MLRTLAISNYRSIRELVVPLGPLNLCTGPNGSGKSNLYRALRLLADVAHDRAIGSIAAEGGIQSVKWAGPSTISRRMERGEVEVEGNVRTGPVSLRIGVAGDDLSYAIDFGLPVKDEATMFQLDPMIKRESIWSGDRWSRRKALIERRGPHLEARNGEGAWETVTSEVPSDASMLTHAVDPRSTPEAFQVRRAIASWRFYDQFRSDRDAPARGEPIGTRTAALGHDGHDLAAALQTILEIGDAEALAANLARAFAGAELWVESVDGRFGVRFKQPGLLRPLGQTELSDGTLRYLLWLAALLTPRPGELVVLNEPETSLHEDLLPPLADLILQLSRRTQVWVVSHSPRLIAALARDDRTQMIQLAKTLSETRIADQTAFDRPAWAWPAR